ncbi:MAG: hypothetical protein AAFY82_01280 [Pseudomonadota bacterium]
MKKAFYAVNRNDARFFFFAAIVVLAFGLIGFLPTFVAAMFAGFDTIPMRVHIHGVFMVGWLILLATQAYLVWQDRLISHRFFGRLGVLLFFLAYASLVTLAVNNLMKTVPPFVDVGLSKVFALQIKSIVFMPILFGLAIWTAHRDTDAHRRLMVLLSAMLVEAAVVRMPWLPGVDGLNTAPLTIVAYSLIPLLPVPMKSTSCNQVVNRDGQ